MRQAIAAYRLARVLNRGGDRLRMQFHHRPALDPGVPGGGRLHQLGVRAREGIGGAGDTVGAKRQREQREHGKQALALAPAGQPTADA